MLPVPGDFIIPKFVSSWLAKMVSWNASRESPVLVVMPTASGEVWVKTKVSGVAMYKPSNTPLKAAKSSVYCCARCNSFGSSGSSKRSRTWLPKAKAFIYSSAEAT